MPAQCLTSRFVTSKQLYSFVSIVCFLHSFPFSICFRIHLKTVDLGCVVVAFAFCGCLFSDRFSWLSDCEIRAKQYQNLVSRFPSFRPHGLLVFFRFFCAAWVLGAKLMTLMVSLAEIMGCWFSSGKKVVGALSFYIAWYLGTRLAIVIDYYVTRSIGI